MDLDRTFAALSDPTRRAICQRLAHGQATVGQLAALFPISRPAVSQHLKVLKEAGLVRAADPGRLSAYELASAPLLDVEAYARRLVDTWQGSPLPAVPKALSRALSEQDHASAPKGTR
jgi:DNA-binding transcriptional ArsR family regulator